MSSPSTTKRTGAGRLRSTWLAAPVPEGLVLVGEQHALDVPLPGEAEAAERAIPLLAAGAPADAVAVAAGIEPDEAAELIERLGECDAFEADAGEREEETAPAAIEGLGSVIVGASAPAAAGDPWRLIATAEELLAVPADLDRARLLVLLRDLLAGIRPLQRRRAYCYALAARRATVRGDRPAAASVQAALARLDDRDPAAIHLFDLCAGGELALDLERVGRIGAAEPHRLGTVLTAGLLDDGLVSSHLGIHVALVDYALPDVSVPEHAGVPLQAKGAAADRETALLVARAEAAERFGGGDRTAVEVVRAAAEDLEGEVIESTMLAAENARQRERDSAARGRADFDPRVARPWVRAEPLTADAEPAWAPAEAVFCPWIDPGGPRRIHVGSSNGLAAGPDLEGATEAALRELVERDAFVWTWVQRVSRELIAPASLPADVRSGVDALAGLGFETAFVNLTLETDPVVLCVVHAAGTMTVGAGSAADPARAVRSALDEAGVTRLGVSTRDELPAHEEVLIPADHEALYRSGDAADRAEFLFASEETIELADLRGAGVPLLDSVRAMEGVGEPLRVDLTTPRTAPFAVARVLAPGLIPIAFGYDGEPLGMPRLARARRTADGRSFGADLDLDRAGPLVPHPFA